MTSPPAIAIFDIGKTNKKLFVFDEQYRVLLEQSVQLEEITDEDGDPCENLEALTSWVIKSINSLVEPEDIQLNAINFSTYGASFVHIDKEGRPVAPLYNYLKAFPDHLHDDFYKKYGGEKEFSLHTASPVLGNLNAGLQLYYLKKEKPALFEKIQYALHLPQYFSHLLTGRRCSDITSIGCHTALWNFTQNHYHEWIYREGIADRLAPVFPSDQLITTSWKGKPLGCGAGLHDSSAALIPYLAGFNEPFVLLSTGTWCISLNPFNHARLTAEELEQDCLCFMEYRGKPVKAARLFAGYVHEQQIKRLGAHFNVKEGFYKSIVFNISIAQRMSFRTRLQQGTASAKLLPQVSFEKRDLTSFNDYSEAYHQLMMDIMFLQFRSTSLVLKDTTVKNIFVDGGFGKNPVYMNLLAFAFPGIAVYAASLAQASAMGAALAVHQGWNQNNFPANLIELKLYADIEPIEI